MAKLDVKVDLESLKKDLRKVVLTAVGAVVLAKEGAFDLTKKFLAKGEATEPDIRKAFKKLAQRRKAVVETANDLRAKVDGRFQKFVSALPLVTRKDMATLTDRISSLAAKVDALAPKKRQK